MAKKTTLPTAEDNFWEEDRKAVLRAVYDKVETDPPVGERYESLLKGIIAGAIDDRGLKLSRDFKESLVNDLFSYIASYGPIEQFFDEPQISEIMVNGPDQIFIEKNGR